MSPNKYTLRKKKRLPAFSNLEAKSSRFVPAGSLEEIEKACKSADLWAFLLGGGWKMF